MSVPRRILEPQSVDFRGENTIAVWEILCPTCGNCVEQFDTSGFGGDHGAVTIHPDRDDYDSPIGTRGGYVQIDLECAGGAHVFSLVSANHKGSQYLGLVMRPNDQSVLEA